MTDEQILANDAWEAYRELRHAKKSRAPFTDKARERILTKLKALEAQGQSVEDMLWQSVEFGWTSIYPVKTVSSRATVIGSLTVPSVAFESTQRYLAEQKPESTSAERRDEIARQLRDTRARLLMRRVAA